jgi:hypothetical protein
MSAPADSLHRGGVRPAGNEVFVPVTIVKLRARDYWHPPRRLSRSESGL